MHEHGAARLQLALVYKGEDVDVILGAHRGGDNGVTGKRCAKPTQLLSALWRPMNSDSTYAVLPGDRLLETAQDTSSVLAILSQGLEMQSRSSLWNGTDLPSSQASAWCDASIEKRRSMIPPSVDKTAEGSRSFTFLAYDKDCKTVCRLAIFEYYDCLCEFLREHWLGPG